MLLVGSEGVQRLTPTARRALDEIPAIVLDYPEVESPVRAAVRFTTAVYGLHRPGTAYRMDEVPIPLRQVLPSPLPADHEILDAMGRALRTQRRMANSDE